jgi:16S rRNA processing protein RimM
MVDGSLSEVETRSGVGPEAWVEVGHVLRPKGLHGPLLVQLFGEEPDNLIGAGRIQLRGSAGTIPFVLSEARAEGHDASGCARVLVRLAGLERRDQAQLWSGAALLIPETALRALPEGEFYWRDIVGLAARLPDGEPLGRVEEIWPTGAHDLLVIRDGVRRYLIPAAGPALMRIDVDAGEVWIDPPRELLRAEA